MTSPAPTPQMPLWTQYRPAQRYGFLAILFLVSLSNYIDRNVISVLIEPIKAEFHVSDAMMGLLTGFAFAAVYAVMGLPVARFADRGDRRLVITLSLATWSVMTMLCGAARTFPQLALARIGVGIGEAGAIPPAQSLIADYFPPEQRTRALAVFMVSAVFSVLIAFTAGSYLAATWGWRTAFVALGLPGLLLAVLTWLGLREPRKDVLSATGDGREGIPGALLALWRKRSFVLLTLAMVMYFFVTYGALSWLPPYMKRVLAMDPVAAGASYGAVSAGSLFIGTLVGGVVPDRLARRDPRWLARAPALLLIAVLPVYEAGLLTASHTLFFVAAFIGGIGLGAAVPAMFSVLHQVCGSTRRAMAVAIIFFFSNLLGLGFGPLLTGALSDAFTAHYGPVGLRYALLFAFCFLLPAGALLWACANALISDSEV